MAEILKVDPEALTAMATRFADRSMQVETITKAFEANIKLIQTAAFLGHVGDAVDEKFTSEFAPRLLT
ncbi:MAG: hypothetical protein AAGH46_11210, partial [Bacteroidota bacterium]